MAIWLLGQCLPGMAWQGARKQHIQYKIAAPSGFDFLVPSSCARLPDMRRWFRGIPSCCGAATTGIRRQGQLRLQPPGGRGKAAFTHAERQPVLRRKRIHECRGRRDSQERPSSDAVPRWHHADLRTAGLHFDAGSSGAEAPRQSNSLPSAAPSRSLPVSMPQ